MKKTLLTTLLLFISINTLTQANTSLSFKNDSMHATVFSGLRLGSSDLKFSGVYLVTQSTVGMDIDFKLPRKGLYLAISAAQYESTDIGNERQSNGTLLSNESDLEGTEWRLGLRTYKESRRFSRFLGIGLAHHEVSIDSEVTVNGVEASISDPAGDSTLGGYLEAGFSYKLTRLLDLGGNLGYSFGEKDGFNYGGTTMALHVGVSL